MAFGNGYVFGFATAVCVFCSLLVATASQSLKEKQQTNIRRDFRQNVLSALNLPDDGSAPKGEQIDQLYEARVRIEVVDVQGNPLPDKTIDDVNAARASVKGTEKDPGLYAVYERIDEGGIAAYAIPLYGVGLWGPISGFLALGPDGYSIIGATFFAPKETPGLGYEITSPSFVQQWTGKKVFDGSAPRPVRVVKGDADLLCPGAVDYCVDGVSGATITSRGVDVMVTEAVQTYEPYLARVRAGGSR